MRMTLADPVSSPPLSFPRLRWNAAGQEITVYSLSDEEAQTARGYTRDTPPPPIIVAGNQLASVAIPESWLQPHPSAPDRFLVVGPTGQNLTVEPSGALSWSSDTGAYQTFARDHNRIAALAVGEGGNYFPTGAYALPVIVGV